MQIKAPRGATRIGENAGARAPWRVLSRVCWIALTTPLALLAGCASSSQPAARHETAAALQQPRAAQTKTTDRAAAKKKGTPEVNSNTADAPLAEAPLPAGDVDPSRAVLTQARDALWLEVEGKRHRATASFACNELTGARGWRCLSTVADDTIHVTEFDHQRVTAKHNNLRLLGADGKAAKNVVRVGSGSPEKMHRDGYARVIEAKLAPSGALNLPAASPDNPYLVFAVLRVSADWMVKYVWVVGSPADDER